MRIMIIGPGGAGKSTFARQLGERAGLPVHHLDKYYWRAGWEPTPDEEWDRFMEELVRKDDWIIDGNFGRTMDVRMKAADVIIYFDMPTVLCLYRIVKRRLRYHGKARPDMNEGCREMLDWEFVKWVWQFRKTHRQGILRKLANLKEKKVIILRKPAEAGKLLKEMGNAVPQ